MSAKPPAAVYSAISAVMADLASEGISKDRRNSQQGYNFRGIDDVYNALAPTLAKHKLLMLPRVVSRSQVERQTQKGGVLFYTTVEVEFDLVSGEDGSSHTIKTVGEAMDSADKSSNKAMSAAYKYAAMQAFCIPTEGDNDADGTTHEVAPQKTAPSLGERVAKASDAMRRADSLADLDKLWGLTGDLQKDLAGEEYAAERKAFTDLYAECRAALNETPFDHKEAA